MIAAIFLIYAANKYDFGESNQTISLGNSKPLPPEMFKFIESNGTEGEPYVVEKGDGIKLKDSPTVILSPRVTEKSNRATCEIDFKDERIIIDCDNSSFKAFLEDTIRLLKVVI
jgi:hypothetical protein